MKRLLEACCIVLFLIFLTPCWSFAYHNNFYSATWTCDSCHPGGPHAHIPECIECHDNATGANYTDFDAPEMMTHSSEAMGAAGQYGTWARVCLDCHEPHRHNGISKTGDVQPSDPSRVLAEFTVNYAVTVDHKTTVQIVSPITVSDSQWLDPTTWGGKTGNPERGLVALVVIQGKTYTYKVNYATPTSLNFNTGWAWFPQAPYSNPFQMRLAYGMFIRPEVTSIGLVPETLPVIYSGPKSMALDESESGFDPTPVGICQVCHSQTLHWRRDGSLADHFNGQDCIMCHPHEKGFKVTYPTADATATPLSPCE